VPNNKAEAGSESLWGAECNLEALAFKVAGSLTRLKVHEHGGVQLLVATQHLHAALPCVAAGPF
jgi:hypothetical protein